MRTAWYFDRKEKKKAAAYDVFKRAISDPHVLDECDITPQVREALLEDIRKKLTPQAVKIRADIEVSCFSYEGIDAIKSALIAGKNCSTDTMPIKINLIAAPHFVVTTQTLDREHGLSAVNAALNVVKETIEKYGGKFSIKEEARVVTDVDDNDIKKKLELAEIEEEGSDEEDEDESENEDDDGLVAPKGLDQQMDAEEASREARKKERKANNEENEKNDQGDSGDESD